MRVVVVPEFDDERMAFEQRLHDAALHAPPAAVDEPDFRQSCVARGLQVLVDDGGNVRGPECVQIELAGDGNGDGFVVQFIYFWSFRTSRRRSS